MKNLFKLFTVTATMLLGIVSCNREADVSVPEPVLVKHTVSQVVSVPVTMVNENDAPGEETKSVVTAAVENFKNAYLFAFASDGGIYTFEDNTPIAIYTEDKSFDWALPVKETMSIWAIVNPMESQKEILNGFLTKADLKTSDLEALTFTCSTAYEMSNMETAGMPMSGIMRNVYLESAEDPVVFTLRRLFARYDFKINTSKFAEKGWDVTAARILASRSNTEAPYFYTGSGVGFSQTESSKLNVVDMATEQDIESINDLDENNKSSVSATLYFLENCQGDASGTATKWNTVGTELADEVQLCSYIEFSVNATKVGFGDRSFKYRLYLGQNADMKSNFDIIRNKHKKINITLDAPTDGFQWTNTTALKVAPGESITVPFETSLKEDELEFIVYEEGVQSGNVVPDNWRVYDGNLSRPESSRQTSYTHYGTVTFKASESANDGTKSFSIYGGNGELHERAELLVAYDFNFTFGVLSKTYDYYPEMQQIDWSTTGALFTENEIDYIISHGVITPSVACKESPITLTKYEIPGIPTSVSRRFQLRASMMPWFPGSHSFSLAIADQSFNAPKVDVKAPNIHFKEPHSGEMDPHGFEVSYNGYPADMDIILSYPSSGNPPQGFPEGLTVVGGHDGDANSFELEIMKFSEGEWFASTTSTSTSARASIRTLSFAGMDFDSSNRYISDSHDMISIQVVYPHGYTIGERTDLYIENPLYGIDFPATPYEYEVHKGRTAQKEYVSVANVDTSDTNVYTVENMLTWPDRRFTVDLTRGGTVDMSQFVSADAWKENGTQLSLWGNNTAYSFDGQTLSFRELNSTDSPYSLANTNMFVIGGPNYIGKRLEHIVSGEKATFIHSIVREYCHYNVFATFDAREDKNVVRDNIWSDTFSGSIIEDVEDVEAWKYNQSGVTLLKRFAAIKATKDLIGLTALTFGMGTPLTVLGGMTAWSLLADSAVTVIDTELKSNFPPQFYFGPLSNFISVVKPEHVNALGTRGAREDSASGNSFVENYAVPEPGDPSDGFFYTVGYSRGSSSTGYHLIGLEGEYIGGLGGSIVNAPNWRTMIARNTPGYKVNTGGSYNVTKTGAGEYNFGGSTDPSGRGYFYFHPFWEGKEGRFAIKAKELSPNTDYGTEIMASLGDDFSVTIANGWYDPSLYTDGIPLLFNKVGKYFFPDSPSDTKRAGMFPYYPGETPWTDSQSSDREKDLYDKSSLNTRDTDHNLSPRNYSEWQACPIRPGEEY